MTLKEARKKQIGVESINLNGIKMRFKKHGGNYLERTVNLCEIYKIERIGISTQGNYYIYMRIALH